MWPGEEAVSRSVSGVLELATLPPGPHGILTAIPRTGIRVLILEIGSLRLKRLNDLTKVTEL